MFMRIIKRFPEIILSKRKTFSNMRIILLLLVLITFENCVNLEYLNSFEGLHGKPEIVESKTYKIEYDRNLITEKIAHSEMEYYDLEGRKIKSNSYKSDGTTDDGDRLYDYNKHGNLVRETLYKKDGSVNYKIENEYNQFGQLIINDFVSAENKMIREYTFNRITKTSKFDRKNQDGIILERAVFKYDSNWRKIEFKGLDNNNDQTSRIQFFYDERGNEIKSKWYNSGNNLYNYYNKTFNLKNDIIKTERYSISDGKLKFVSAEEFEYKYDKHKNIIEKKLISNGKISWITRYNYTYFR